MKTITLNVSEPVYADFRQASKRLDRSTSELIREAMEQYRRGYLQPRRDLRDFRLRSLGRVRKSLHTEDDLLGKMLDT
jgi:predicted CopG family antitoxin